MWVPRGGGDWRGWAREKEAGGCSSSSFDRRITCCWPPAASRSWPFFQTLLTKPSSFSQASHGQFCIRSRKEGEGLNDSSSTGITVLTHRPRMQRDIRWYQPHQPLLVSSLPPGWIIWIIYRPLPNTAHTPGHTALPGHGSHTPATPVLQEAQEPHTAHHALISSTEICSCRDEINPVLKLCYLLPKFKSENKQKPQNHCFSMDN